MKRMLGIGLCACLLLGGLCACASTKPADSTTAATTSRTELVLLDIALDTLVTKEQIEQAVGKEMTAPQVKGNGTQLYFLSSDGTVSVRVNMQKQERARFDQSIQAFPETTEAPNLGEAAFWVDAYETLFVYVNGYEMNICIGGSDMEQESLLVASRQIAALVVEKL